MVSRCKHTIKSSGERNVSVCLRFFCVFILTSECVKGNSVVCASVVSVAEWSSSWCCGGAAKLCTLFDPGLHWGVIECKTDLCQIQTWNPFSCENETILLHPPTHRQHTYREFFFHLWEFQLHKLLSFVLWLYQLIGFDCVFWRAHRARLIVSVNETHKRTSLLVTP